MLTIRRPQSQSPDPATASLHTPGGARASERRFALSTTSGWLADSSSRFHPSEQDTRQTRAPLRRWLSPCPSILRVRASVARPEAVRCPSWRRRGGLLEPRRATAPMQARARKGHRPFLTTVPIPARQSALGRAVSWCQTTSQLALPDFSNIVTRNGEGSVLSSRRAMSRRRVSLAIRATSGTPMRCRAPARPFLTLEFKRLETIVSHSSGDRTPSAIRKPGFCV